MMNGEWSMVNGLSPIQPAANTFYFKNYGFAVSRFPFHDFVRCLFIITLSHQLIS